MGNCCGSKSDKTDDVYIEKKERNDPNKLPKIIVTPKDTAIIYLNVSPTNQSNRLRKSLKRQFPTLLELDGEQRLVNHVDSMKQRKCYVIGAGFIHNQTLKSLVSNSKVKALYFCLEQIDLNQFSTSKKIKGFFVNQSHLKRTIFYDLRLNDQYS